MKTYQISINGALLIKSYESLRLTAYLPTPDDVWTIGWGTTRIDGRPVLKGETISLNKAEELFNKDVYKFESAVNEYVKVDITQNQFDALVSFVYNIGIGAFKKSTLLRKLNSEDYIGASKEFLRWNKQAGKVLRGLTRRREAESKLFSLDIVEEKENSIEEIYEIFNNEEIIECQIKDKSES